MTLYLHPQMQCNANKYFSADIQCRILSTATHHIFCQPSSLSGYELIHLFLLAFITLKDSNLALLILHASLGFFFIIFMYYHLEYLLAIGI